MFNNCDIKMANIFYFLQKNINKRNFIFLSPLIDQEHQIQKKAKTALRLLGTKYLQKS